MIFIIQVKKAIFIQHVVTNDSTTLHVVYIFLNMCIRKSLNLIYHIQKHMNIYMNDSFFFVIS